jgi:hypothetical protein
VPVEGLNENAVAAFLIKGVCTPVPETNTG